MARRRSNTVGNKIKEQDALSQKMNNSSICQQPTTRKIIISRTNKTSQSVEVNSNLPGQSLFKLVYKEFYIPQQNQILFYKGEKIMASKQNNIRIFSFAQKDVIHVHKKELKGQLINVSLVFLTNDFIKFNEIVLPVSPTQIVKNALQDSFVCELQNIFKCYFIQSGRFLSLDETFQSQHIEDGSIIIIIPKKPNLSPLGKLQQRQIEIIDMKSKLFTNSIKANRNAESANFKKKCKCNVYHSTLVEESKQLIWEEESSQSPKKTNYKRFIIKKKPKNQQNQNQILKENLQLSTKVEVGSQKQNNINQIIENSQRLKEIEQQTVDAKKLYSSACLLKNYQKKILKPPISLIKNDFFDSLQQFDEQQEMDIQMDIDMEEQCNADCLGSSAPLSSFQDLKCSIGKSRGDFTPPAGLANMPPPLSNDDDQQDFQDF